MHQRQDRSCVLPKVVQHFLLEKAVVKHSSVELCKNIIMPNSYMEGKKKNHSLFQMNASSTLQRLLRENENALTWAKHVFLRKSEALLRWWRDSAFDRSDNISNTT